MSETATVLQWSDVDKIAKRINDSFLEAFFTDKKTMDLIMEAQSGKPDYRIANEYAVRIGELLGNAMKEEAAGYDAMPYEVAQALIKYPLKNAHDSVVGITELIQNNMNRAAGIGLSAIKPQFDTNRVDGLAKALSECNGSEEIRELMGEPVINFTQSIVDRSVRDNAAANSKAGLKAYIVRQTGAAEVRTAPLRIRRGNKVYTYQRQYKVPCKWCAGLAGTYEYNKVSNTGNNVFHRHESCRCTVTYRQGLRAIDVWSKNEWTEAQAVNQAKTVKKETAKKLTRNKRKEQIDTRLHEIGFSTVEDSVFRNVDETLLGEFVTRLEELENRFNVWHRSVQTYVEYRRGTSNAAVERYLDNPAHQGLLFYTPTKNREEWLRSMFSGVRSGWYMPVDTDNEYLMATRTMAHEYGHAFHNLMYRQAEADGYRGTINEYVRQMDSEVFDIARGLSTEENFDPFNYLSQYGKKNQFETWAEMFGNALGGKPNILGDAMNIWLKQKGY